MLTDLSLNNDNNILKRTLFFTIIVIQDTIENNLVPRAFLSQGRGGREESPGNEVVQNTFGMAGSNDRNWQGCQKSLANVQVMFVTRYIFVVTYPIFLPKRLISDPKNDQSFHP